MATRKAKPRKAATKSSGKKRNPSPKARAAASTAADRKALQAAIKLARSFHDTAQGQVVELSAKERKPLPRYVAVAGELTDFTYAPSAKSKRSGARWTHQSGDRGPLKARAKKMPLLVADPLTGRPAVITDGSPMRLTARGFVG